MSPEDELIEEYRRGDRGAGERFVEWIAPRLRSYLLRVTGSRRDAEELSQETLTRFFGALDRYRPEGRAASYVLGIATNLHRNLRSRTREEPGSDVIVDLPVDDPGPHGRAERREAWTRVRRALAGLPDEERRALVLKEYHRLRYEEIGRILDVSVGAVKQKIFRARQKLRARLIETPVPGGRIASGGPAGHDLNP